MGNSIFLLDISHLTETGMTSFMKLSIFLQFTKVAKTN